MASNRKRCDTDRTRGEDTASRSDPLASMVRLVDASDDRQFDSDIAGANLLCASGLPGAGPLDIDRYLEWLDEAARKVQIETDRHYHKFIDNPKEFDLSQARFCMVCLVTVLQRQCGVGYNPKWKGLTPDGETPDSFGLDASDLFIHAIIDGMGGTCGSLPVLYVAVGCRLGYPLRIVKAARHLFVRWDDPDGEQWIHSERFNIEATGPGIHFLPDEHYLSWPHAIADEDVKSGTFLRSLTPREEFAEFLATRGYCLQSNGHLREAVDALGEASRLAPHNRHFAASHQSLQLHLAMVKRGHAFLNAPVLDLTHQPEKPFWMDGHGGQKMLVQIVSPVRQPFSQPPDIGRRLIRQDVSTPNGNRVEAWLPLHEPTASMTAHWLRLPDGRHALVHKPTTKSPLRPRPTSTRQHKTPFGHPILPDTDQGIAAVLPGATPRGRPKPMSIHEQALLASQINQVARLRQRELGERGLPPMPPLAIPAGPVAPRLTGSSIHNDLSI